MSWPPVTVGPDETARRAARLMYSRKLRRLPVVGHRGRLIGIVTRADLTFGFSSPFGPGTLVPDLTAGTTLAADPGPRS